MAIISRAEAVHRLQTIASGINCAVRAARDGDWKDACEFAGGAQDELKALLPHLEEAFDLQPDPVPEHHLGHVGGMGYRGSAGCRTDSSSPAPVTSARTVNAAPSKVETVRNQSYYAPPEPIANVPAPPRPRTVIITPPPAAFKPIVTPAPAPKPVSRELPDVEEIVTFDPARIPDSEAFRAAEMALFQENQKRAWTDQIPSAPVTDIEWFAAHVFEALSPDAQEQILRAGHPVTARIRVKQMQVPGVATVVTASEILEIAQ